MKITKELLKKYGFKCTDDKDSCYTKYLPKKKFYKSDWHHIYVCFSGNEVLDVNIYLEREVNAVFHYLNDFDTFLQILKALKLDYIFKSNEKI